MTEPLTPAELDAVERLHAAYSTPEPKPLPEQDTRAAEAMAARSDADAYRRWKEDRDILSGKLASMVPTLLSEIRLSRLRSGSGVEGWKSALEQCVLDATVNVPSDPPGMMQHRQEIVDHYGPLLLSSAPEAPVGAGWREAIQAIADERQRQIDVEGWTREHDDDHGTGELAKAAACYAVGNQNLILRIPDGRESAEWAYREKTGWPWSAKWWKPIGKRQNLIKAGALIVAEIERLDRLGTSSKSDNGPKPDLDAAARQAVGRRLPTPPAEENKP